MSIPGYQEPFPSNDRIVDKEGRPTRELNDWIELSLLSQLQASPVRVQPAEVLTGIIGNTVGTLGGDQVAGLYRVTAYREVTIADPVSSGLAIDIAWTHNGKAMTRTLSPFAGAPQVITDSAGDVTAMEIDPGTPISYTLTYASNTPGLAQFSVTMSAELVQTIA